MDPAVQRLDRAPRRAANTERLALPEHAVDQASDGELGRYPAPLRAADAVGECRDSALARAAPRLAEPGGSVVLIAGAGSAFAVEADAELKPGGRVHCCLRLLGRGCGQLGGRCR